MPKPVKLRKVFAVKVRAMRQLKGWSQEELAERASVHRTFIGQVERGEVNLSVDNMEKIAKALESTVKELL